MNRINKTIVIIMCAFFVSCVNYYWTPDTTYRRPKRPKFALAKEKFVFNNLIDTTAIYLSTDTLHFNGYSTSYLKFYNNGRIINGIIDNGEKLTKENLLYFTIGYYNLKGTNLTTEFFIVDSAEHHSLYSMEKGIVKGDTIVIFQRDMPDQNYIKQKIDFIPKPSTW